MSEPREICGDPSCPNSELWWSRFMRFGDSGSPTGAPVFGNEQRGGRGVELFFSGSRLNVACPGGNDNATLSPVLHKPPPLSIFEGGGVRAAVKKKWALSWLHPPSEWSYRIFGRNTHPHFLPSPHNPSRWGYQRRRRFFLGPVGYPASEWS